MITMMFWDGNGGWVWWQAGLMWFAVIAFWALLIWAIYALITGLMRREGGSVHRGPGDAHRILDERLARGEIDTEAVLSAHGAGQRLLDILDRGPGRSAAGTGSGR
jgi:uncharacterized membrane protein